MHGTSGQPSVHLPGSEVVIVQGLHMADPKTQGIGGAVRMVQAFLGVDDSHCVDVGAWRRLSTQEMLDRHMSPDDVEKIAEEYHCPPA